MQVKVFESKDMASGLKMIKDELGPDALILSTKTIRSSKFGLLGKSTMEITAAVDSQWNEPISKQSPFEVQPTSPTQIDDTVCEREDLLTYNSGMHINFQKPERQEPVLPKGINPEGKQDALQTEVDELKSMIKNLAKDMNRMHVSSAPPVQPAAVPEKESSTELLSLTRRLLDYGVNRENSGTISNYARETLTMEELSDPFKQEEYLAETFANLLQVNENIFPDETRQHRIALVGPTGVGKTTTLAKIAAGFISSHSPSIALITIDTYSIAAVEQLKVYGGIMNLPVEVVLNPQQLEHMLLKHRDKDLILIDTAGRSPKDSLCIDELAGFLTPELNIQKHLVLSATTRESELFDAMKRFATLGIDNTIITKIDECSTLGLLLDIQIKSSLPFSFVTNGQRVPEDLLQADKKLLTDLIMTPGKGLANE